MRKRKKFKYIGLNGTILSPVLLPNIDKIEFIELEADEKKILTDGIVQKKKVLILPENISLWTEIDD